MFDAQLKKLQLEQKLQLAELRLSSRRAARVMSPKRMVREHPLACSAAALIAGMWVGSTPAKSHAPEPSTPASHKSGGIWNSIQGVLTKLVPHAANGHSPGPDGKPQDPHNPPVNAPHEDHIGNLAKNANHTLQIITLLGTALLEKLNRPANAPASPSFHVADAGSMISPTLDGQPSAWDSTKL